MSTVKSSNLPRSIRKERTHLPTCGICSKLLTGPTSPIPGPTFPRVVATEPIAVIKSRPSSAIIKEPKVNTVR